MAKTPKQKRRDGNGKRRPEMPVLDPRAKRELLAILIFVLALVSLLALFDAAGPGGRHINNVLSALFGLTKYFTPFALAIAAARIAWPERVMVGTPIGLGAFLLFTSLGGLLNVIKTGAAEAMRDPDRIAVAGGYFGLLLGYPLIASVGFWASVIVLVGLIAVSLLLTFNVSVHEVTAHIFGLRHMQLPWPFGHRGGDAGEHDEFERRAHPETDAVPLFSKRPVAEAAPGAADPAMGATATDGYLTDDAVPAVAPVRRPRAKKVEIPLDLLEDKSTRPNGGDVLAKQNVIKRTLENFGIPSEMGDVSVGPTVTQFALRPADGIKLNRITSLSNDLALALAAHPIRIEAPIPGKSLVGIEVPNHAVAVVGLKEVISSKEFRERRSSLTFALGKDVAGKPWVADLGRMPHLLVAGATGSGKTVCLNTIILSLLFENGPDDLKLMLIDPKRVELPVYNGIPHLITPAITEIPKIVNALKWALGEMDRRFELLSRTGCRDITSYNERNPEEKMPFLVIVVDELADLMVASASEVEPAIIRLAQLARAVGIHLILATQRPSVDVITGLIKANIPARIAFAVASGTDSRTILDSLGAENLVGRGDSLFVTADLSAPKRIQGCFVSDREIRKVVDHLVSQLEVPVEYEPGVTERNKGAGGMNFGYNEDGDDELLEEARDTVVRAGKASASYLQRRLKIGYARAARLLDLMEEKGIIGPGDGAKPRQILVAPPVSDSDGNHYSERDDDFDAGQN